MLLLHTLDNYTQPDSLDMGWQIAFEFVRLKGQPCSLLASEASSKCLSWSWEHGWDPRMLCAASHPVFTDAEFCTALGSWLHLKVGKSQGTERGNHRLPFIWDVLHNNSPRVWKRSISWTPKKRVHSPRHCGARTSLLAKHTFWTVRRGTKTPLYLWTWRYRIQKLPVVRWVSNSSNDGPSSLCTSIDLV